MVRTAFLSQDATNDCRHYIDGNVHTEERMGNVVDAMELLGLEGRRENYGGILAMASRMAWIFFRHQQTASTVTSAPKID